MNLDRVISRSLYRDTIVSGQSHRFSYLNHNSVLIAHMAWSSYYLLKEPRAGKILARGIESING